MASSDIIKNGNYEIILIESYLCNSSNELRALDKYYTNNIKRNDLNNPHQTMDDLREVSQTIEKNRNLIRSINRKCRNNHKIQNREANKIWRENNPVNLTQDMHI